MHGVESPQFRQLLGRFATGVTVLTTRTPDGRPIGMTASSVASVSLVPPLLLVSVSHEHDMHPALQAAQHFALNILAADQEAVSRRFAVEHPDRFSRDRLPPQQAWRRHSRWRAGEHRMRKAR